MMKPISLTNIAWVTLSMTISTSYAEDVARYERGLQTLETVDGRAGEEVVRSIATISPSLARYIVEYPFGDVYSREGLSVAQREIATIAMLAAIGGTEKQLDVHIKAGLRAGLSQRSIEEIIIQSSVYAGFPRAINAMMVFKEVIDNMPPTSETVSAEK